MPQNRPRLQAPYLGPTGLQLQSYDAYAELLIYFNCCILHSPPSLVLRIFWNVGMQLLQTPKYIFQNSCPWYRAYASVRRHCAWGNMKPDQHKIHIFHRRHAGRNARMNLDDSTNGIACGALALMNIKGCKNYMGRGLGQAGVTKNEIRPRCDTSTGGKHAWDGIVSESQVVLLGEQFARESAYEHIDVFLRNSQFQRKKSKRFQ